MASLLWLGTGFVIGSIALAGWSVAALAEPSGAVVAVVQSSNADGATGKRILLVDGPVYSGDKIITGPFGEAQIKFHDNTRLVVGPNSMMVIDAFVFSDRTTAQKFSLNAVRGAFRFITGASPKKAYSIRTPSATIGVRGTEFDFNVDRYTGATQLLMFGGETRFCPTSLDPLTHKKRPCIEAKDQCGLSIIEVDEPVRKLKRSQERNILINRFFRYAWNQRRLLADFRLDVSSCGNINVNTFQNNPGSPPPIEPLPDPDFG